MSTALFDPKGSTKKVRLLDSYNRWFEVVPANTHHQLLQAFRLRFQVYCQENHYEDPSLFPDGCETDEYDSRSVHSLLIDQQHGAVCGTVRLILPSRIDTHNCFPIQRICSLRTLRAAGAPLHDTAAEISRFAISKHPRLHILPNKSPTGLTNEELSEKRALLPVLALGLIRGAIRMSHEQGVTDWFAIMEPSLLRLLSRFGIYFRPIGPIVDYHGKRQACYASIGDILERVYRDRFDVWEIITDEGRYMPDTSPVSRLITLAGS